MILNIRASGAMIQKIVELVYNPVSIYFNGFYVSSQWDDIQGHA